jgi:hypothetical protein
MPFATGGGAVWAGRRTDRRSTPAALGAHLKSESELWGPVIKAAGIKSEE